EEEIALVAAVDESAKGITGVEIKRSYRGTFYHTFLPHSLARGGDVECGVSLLRHRLAAPAKTFSSSFKQQYDAAFKVLLQDVRDHGGTRHARARLPEF